MAQNVESLAVGFDDQISAGAKAAEQALQNLGNAAVATEEKVTRTTKSGDALAKQYDRTAREAAAVARATAGLRRDLQDLELSESSVEAKEKQRAVILGQIEVATQKARASVERYFTAAEAGAAASVAAANAQSAGMAAATASANSWAGAMARVYETASTAANTVNGVARALQALNADFRAGHTSFAEWIAGARGLETALRGISAAQKAINENTGVSRSPVNTATIGDLKYAVTGKGASSGNTLALVTGDAEASARRLKDIEAAFGAVDAELERYREELGLVDVAQKRYEAGLAELEATVRRAGLAEADGAALLRAYADAHDPAVAAAKRLADEEKAALARMSADWDAAVREREADAAMIIADEQATARATAQTAAENAKLAASHRAVMAAVDPTAAAQQRYEQALAELRAGAAAAGKSVEDLAADEERLTAVLSPAAITVQKEETALRSLVGSLDRTFGAEEKLTAQQRLLDRAMTEGIGGIRLTREQHEALSNTLREQHALATRATNSTKLAAHESINLGYQMQDFVVQVGSGQGFLIPLLQQAPQAVGAVGGVTRAMALLTSSTALTAMGIGSLALGFGLVLGRAITIQGELRQFNVLLRATGAQAGMTAEQIHGVVEGMVSAGASRQDAKAVAQTIVRSRKLVGEEITKEVGDLSIDMGVVFGGTAEAGRMLTDWLTTGTKGLRELTAETQALTLEQYESARSALEQGNRQQALGIIIGALKAQYAGLHRESLGPAAAAMEDLTQAYNDLLNTAAQHPIVVTVEVVGADFLRGISKFIKDPLNFEFPTPFDKEVRDFEFPTPFGIGNWLRSRQAKPTLSEGAITGNTPVLPAAPAGTPVPGRKPTSLDGMPLAEAIALSDLTKENDKLLAAMKKVGAERVVEMARVQAEISALNAGKSEKAAELEGVQAARMARAQLTQAVADTNRSAVAEAAGADMVAKAYGASSAAVREASIHQKALAEVARGTIEPYDAIVDRLRKLDDAQRKVQAAQFDRTLRDQSADATRLAEAWGKGAAAAHEATLANEVLAEARKRGLDPTRDGAEIAGLGRGVLARDLAQRAQTFAQMATEQRKAVALANAEYGLLGQGNAERARTVELYRTTIDLQEKGADLTDAGTKAYIAQAGELARVNAILQDSAQNAANIAQPIGTAFEDVVVGAKKAGDAFQALGEDINRIFVRMTFTKPLETAVSGFMTQIMAGPVRTANDNTPKAANDNAILNRIIGEVNDGLGSTPNSAMWVRLAGNAAMDINALSTRAMDGQTVPVAIADGGAVVDAIQSEARAQGVPEEVALAVAKIESGYRQHGADGRVLTSSAGAQGVMQLMPGTAQWLGVDGADTRDNIRGGVKFLAMLGRQFGGDWTMAAAAYNAGPGRVQAWQRGETSLPGETEAYVQKFAAAVGRSAEQATAFSASARTVGNAMVAQSSSVTKAMEDEVQARLDAIPVQQSAVAAQQGLTTAQQSVIDAALGVTDATKEQAAAIEVVARPMDKLRENAITLADAQGEQAKGTKVVADASKMAAAGMVNSTQQALGGIMSLFGGLSGNTGLSIGGSVITAGGPQGVMNSLDRAYGTIVGSVGSPGGFTSWLNTSMFEATPEKAKLFGGDFDTAQAAQAANPAGTAAGGGVTWGQGIGGALGIAGGAMQMSRGGTGNMISGGANMVAGVMAFTPLAWAAPLVSIAGSIIGGLVGNDKPDPVSITNMTLKNGRYARGTFGGDNGGQADKYNAAVDQIATKLNSLIDKYSLVATSGNIAVGDKNATPEQAMLQALKTMKSDNSDIAWVLAHDVKDDLDEAVNAIDFAAKFRDTVALWNSGMSAVVASFQQGRAAANEFGKSITSFLDQAAQTYDVAALSAKASSKTGNAALDTLLNVRGYATGTPSAPAGWAVVGEEGPELVKLAGGERIWNARESAQMLAAMGQGRDDALIHLRSSDELAAVRRVLGTQGTINPATGLLSFEHGGDSGGANGGNGESGGGVGGGAASGHGGENAAHGEVSSSTSARDSAYGGGWGTGGVAGAIDSAVSAISRATTTVAGWVSAVAGWNQAQTEPAMGLLGVPATAVAAGLSALGRGWASVADALGIKGDGPGVGSAGDPAGAGSADPSWVRQMEAAIAKATVDGIKEARATGTYDQMVAGLGGRMVTDTAGIYLDEAAGTYSDPTAALGRISGADLSRMDEALTGLTKAFTDAGEQVPAVLSKAMENVESYAAAHGVQTVKEKAAAAAAQDQRVNDALSASGISGDRFAELNGVVNDLAANTFSPVGKDFRALADDMTKAMQAMVTAGKAVPDTLYAAQKRMEALAAAKSRMDAQIAGVQDSSTDYQKQVAQLTGYWSAASTDLVKAMEAVGYQGDLLSQKLGEGLKNAIAHLNKETAKTYTSELNVARGNDFLNTLSGIRDWFDKNGPDVNKATGDDGAANRMYGARADAVLKGLSIDQLNTVIASSNDNTMQAWAQTYLGKARETFAEDNNLRQLRAKVDLGQVTEEAYNKEALRISQMRELASITDATVRAETARTQALEAQAASMKAVIAAGKSITEWLDNKRGTASAGVSAADAYASATASYKKDLTLAAANDNDALGRITSTADRLLQAYNGLYGSSGSTAFWQKIMGEIGNLPATQRYTEQVVNAINALPHAGGGPASGLTMINDGGPEMVRLPTGSHVMTSRASVDFLRRGLIGAGGGGTTTVISDHREVVAELKQVVRAIVVTADDQAKELREVKAINAQQKKELERLRRNDRLASDSRTQPGRRAG